MIIAGKADALLVTKLDRLTRSVSDLGRLIEAYFSAHGAELMSVSEQIDTRSANGRLTLNVLMSVSQWEREVIGERTSEAMQHLRASGAYTGGHALDGCQRINDRIVAEAVEQQVITQARGAAGQRVVRWRKWRLNSIRGGSRHAVARGSSHSRSSGW